MKPGDLARITVPIPSLFESTGTEPNKVLRCGDLVVLLKHEPTTWYRPCWRVLYGDQVGVIESKWLTSVQKYDRDPYLDVDIEDSDRI